MQHTIVIQMSDPELSPKLRTPEEQSVTQAMQRYHARICAGFCNALLLALMSQGKPLVTIVEQGGLSFVRVTAQCPDAYVQLAHERMEAVLRDAWKMTTHNVQAPLDTSPDK